MLATLTHSKDEQEIAAEGTGRCGRCGDPSGHTLGCPIGGVAAQAAARKQRSAAQRNRTCASFNPR